MRDDAAEHDEARHHHDVAVAALGADEARQPDRARRARDVLHRRDAHQARALQHLLHHARGLIPAAAGRRRRDDAELVDGGLRGSGAPAEAGGRHHDGRAHANPHGQRYSTRSPGTEVAQTWGREVLAALQDLTFARIVQEQPRRAALLGGPRCAICRRWCLSL